MTPPTIRTGRVEDSTLSFTIICKKDSTNMINRGHSEFTCDKCGNEVTIEFW